MTVFYILTDYFKDSCVSTETKSHSYLASRDKADFGFVCCRGEIRPLSNDCVDKVWSLLSFFLCLPCYCYTVTHIKTALKTIII